MNTKRHNLFILLLIIYTICIIYFMFFGFGRPQIVDTVHEYRYSIIPTRIPLWYPRKISLLWLFSLGNLLAFVPFGILIPMIFDTKYPKFIVMFLIAIILLELLQMLTYLGSFDAEDIIVNAIGATIGYISYTFSDRFKRSSYRIMSILLLIVLLTIAMIGIAEVLNSGLAPT